MHNFYAQAAWTYTWQAEQTSGFRTVTDGTFLQGETAGNRMPYAPEHTVTAVLGYEHPSGLDLQFETVYTSSQYGDFLNLGSGSEHPDGATSINALSGMFGEIEANVVFNLAATYSFKPHGLDVFFAVKNLLDRDYVVDRTRGILPGAPRLVQAGVKYSF
jgi:Fe(3+) dicitrate transport protein